MIHNYRHWLPQSAILDGELETKFQTTVQRWAVKWFGETENFSASLISERGIKETSGPSIFWHNESENITFIFYTSNTIAFAERLLKFDFPRNRIGNADKALFEELSRACIEDLQSVLCKDFLLDANFSYLSDNNGPSVKHDLAYRLCVKCDDSPIEVVISLSEDFLSLARKTSLRPYSTEVILGSVDEAIEEQIISMGAHVGTGTVNLLDIESLSTGDILVLDRAIEETINVTINKNIIAGLNCHILQDTKTDELKITQIMMDDVYE